jgi:hypothetical protein
MLSRCYRKNKNGEHSFEAWGGKGIRVCDRWLEPNGRGFQNFLDDIGPRPSHTSLDRVNPQDHYTPLNCRWGTPKEQAIHKTHIMWKDETPPFPRFEIRTNKSTTYLEMSRHTDARCYSTDTKMIA